MSCVFDSVCELFGDTIRNVFGCGCYFVVECYGFVLSQDFLFITFLLHFLCCVEVLPCPLLHFPTMSFMVVQPVFCLQLYTPYMSSPSPRHFSSSHVHTISTTSYDSCDRLNSNQLSQFFTCPSVFHGNTTHTPNHLHLCSFKL